MTLFPKDIETKLLKLYEDGYTSRQMYSDGLMIGDKILTYKEIKHWHRINKLRPNTKRKSFIKSFKLDYKGEDSLFCDTEFLESFFKKPIKKTKECKEVNENET